AVGVAVEVAGRGAAGLVARGRLVMRVTGAGADLGELTDEAGAAVRVGHAAVGALVDAAAEDLAGAGAVLALGARAAVGVADRDELAVLARAAVAVRGALVRERAVRLAARFAAGVVREVVLDVVAVGADDGDGRAADGLAASRHRALVRLVLGLGAVVIRGHTAVAVRVRLAEGGRGRRVLAVAAARRVRRRVAGLVGEGRGPAVLGAADVTEDA